MSTRTGLGAELGGPEVIPNSEDRVGRTSIVTGGGTGWRVASAAKLIFGRARSLSNPNPSPSAISEYTSFRSPRFNALPLQTQGEDRSSIPEPLDMTVPININLNAARLRFSLPNSSTPSLVLTDQSSSRTSAELPSNACHSPPLTGAIKTLSNRGTSILSIHLTEPVLYLTGFGASEYENRAPAILRGTLILKLLKPTKIKTVTLTFKGRARTDWPEGIPPKQTEHYEEKELVTHTWPFFNAQFTYSEISHGADAVRLIDGQRLSADLNRLSADSSSSFVLSDSSSTRTTPLGSPNLSVFGTSILSATNNGIVGIPYGQSRSEFSKDEKTPTQLKGYKVFAPGEYMLVILVVALMNRYNFELPLDSVLPESIDCNMGHVRYELEATIERAGTFKANIYGKTAVLLVRNPGEQNVELYEPISVIRNWYLLKRSLFLTWQGRSVTLRNFDIGKSVPS